MKAEFGREHKMIRKRKKIVLRSDSAILFVCYGNHARSPMAEGLARQYLGNEIRVESAGIHPLFEGAAEEAIRALKNEHGLDISAHRPRHINSFQVSDFDCIVVLDSAVHDFLRKLLLVPPEILHLWPTEDPYSLGYEDYVQTADRLKFMIETNFDVSRLNLQTKKS